MKRLLLVLLFLAPSMVLAVGGQFDWVRHWGGTSNDLGYQVAVAGNSDIVVAGSFQSVVDFGGGSFTSAGGDDIFIGRFNSSGGHVWSKQLGGTGTDVALSVAVGPSDEVVACGYFSGTVDFGSGNRVSAGQSDMFITKYNSAGVYQWSKTFGAQDVDQCNGVVIDSGGNVIVTGVFRWTVNFGTGNRTSALFGAPDMFIAKYASDGTATWANNYSGPSTDYGASVTVDSGGSILLVGGFLGSLNLGGGVMNAHGTTAEDFYVAKFSAMGQHAWSKSFGSTGTDTAASVVTDSFGNVLVTGQFALTVDFGGGNVSAIGQDVYVLKLGGVAGAYVWVKNPVSTGSETGNSITVDSLDNVVVTGYMDGSMDFGGGSLTSAGSADIFVVELSGVNSSNLWARRYGATSFEQGLGVDVSGAKVLVTGYFKGTVDFGGGPVVGTGTSGDVFLLQLGLAQQLVCPPQ